MAVNLQNISATGVRLYTGSGVVNLAPRDNGKAVSESDMVETSSTDASVQIDSNGTTAANVSGPTSRIRVYMPPTVSLVRVYYNYSYRYKLRTPGGYVGIRG